MTESESGKVSFVENDVTSLDLSDEKNLAVLIIKFLCGRNLQDCVLDSQTEHLLKKFHGNIATEGLNLEQFNELLLLLNRDRISEGFFSFFLVKTK